MENVVLTVHLILALLLIGVVLLQRSEGGGLGMGGGGGGSGVMTGRQAANALSKLTWLLATGFLLTSVTLTVIAARNATGGSVLDQLNIGGGESSEQGTMPGLPEYVPPPGVGTPVAPPAPEGAATDAAPATPAASDSAPADAPVAPPAAN